MSLRAFIMMVTAPVFLALALANALLLVQSKQAALDQGMRTEARAAAVTLAAFARQSPNDLAASRRPGPRRRDLLAAIREVDDVENLGIVYRDGTTTPIYGDLGEAEYSPTSHVVIIGKGADMVVRATEPVSADKAVVVELNGRTFAERQQFMYRLWTTILIAVAIYGVLLSLWLARRVARELRGAELHLRNFREDLSQRAQEARVGDYEMREVDELVHAVEVMESLNRNAAQPPAVLSSHQLFDAAHLRALAPSLDRIIGGAHVVARTLGKTAPGALVAAVETPGGGGALVLAEVERAEPGEALSLARALVPVAEAWLRGEMEEADFLRLAGAIRLARVDWTDILQDIRLETLGSDEVNELAANYRARHIAPDAARLLEDLEKLLPAGAGGLAAALEPQPTEAKAASAVG